LRLLSQAIVIRQRKRYGGERSVYVVGVDELLADRIWPSVDVQCYLRQDKRFCAGAERL